MFKMIIIRLKLLLNKAYILSLLIMPLFVVFILFNVDINTENKINIGLCYENPELKDLFHSELMEYSGDAIKFIVFDDEDTLTKNVMAYKIDCGYYFKSGEYKKSIVLYRTPTTTSDSVLNIFISSLALKNRAGELGENVLRGYLNVVDTKEIVEKNNNYLNNGSLMKIRYGLADESETKANTFDDLFIGLFALTALFISILNSGYFINERNSEIYSRIKLNRLGYKNSISQIAALFLMNIAYLFISRLILSSVYEVNQKILNIIIVDISYSLLISLISFFVARILKKDNFIVMLAVFSFLFNFALGGILFDPSDIVDKLGFMKYFSVIYYYLNFLN